MAGTTPDFGQPETREKGRSQFKTQEDVHKDKPRRESNTLATNTNTNTNTGYLACWIQP